MQIFLALIFLASFIFFVIGLCISLEKEGLFYTKGKSDYKTGFECPKCDYFVKKNKAFQDKFYLKFSYCPKCGTYYNKFELKTKRWVSKARLTKPSTWGNGYYEYVKEEQNERYT